jgi:hypothetical protein
MQLQLIFDFNLFDQLLLNHCNLLFVNFDFLMLLNNQPLFLGLLLCAELFVALNLALHDL